MFLWSFEALWSPNGVLRAWLEVGSGPEQPVVGKNADGTALWVTRKADTRYCIFRTLYFKLYWMLGGRGWYRLTGLATPVLSRPEPLQAELSDSRWGHRKFGLL